MSLDPEELPSLVGLETQARQLLRSRKPSPIITYMLLLSEAQAGPVDSEDASPFRRRFNGFYAVRRNSVWRDHFYRLFEAAKTSQAPSDALFEQVVRRLHAETGRVEASFASKLVATLRPDSPIIDSVVAGFLAGHLPKPVFTGSPDLALEFYRRLAALVAQLATTPQAQAWCHWFDTAFPDVPGAALIDPVKKLDFLIWAGSPRTQ